MPSDFFLGFVLVIVVGDLIVVVSVRWKRESDATEFDASREHFFRNVGPVVRRVGHDAAADVSRDEVEARDEQRQRERAAAGILEALAEGIVASLVDDGFADHGVLGETNGDAAKKVDSVVQNFEREDSVEDFRSVSVVACCCCCS